MKKILLASAIAVAAAAMPAAAPAQRAPAASIVVIDTDRVYRECTACRAAQTQIQSMVTSAQQRAQALGQPLQTEAQSLQAAAQAANSQRRTGIIASTLPNEREARTRRRRSRRRFEC